MTPQAANENIARILYSLRQKNISFWTNNESIWMDVYRIKDYMTNPKVMFVKSNGLPENVLKSIQEAKSTLDELGLLYDSVR